MDNNKRRRRTVALIKKKTMPQIFHGSCTTFAPAIAHTYTCNLCAPAGAECGTPHTQLQIEP